MHPSRSIVMASQFDGATASSQSAVSKMVFVARASCAMGGHSAPRAAAPDKSGSTAPIDFPDRADSMTTSSVTSRQQDRASPDVDTSLPGRDGRDGRRVGPLVDRPGGEQDYEQRAGARQGQRYGHSGDGAELRLADRSH